MLLFLQNLISISLSGLLMNSVFQQFLIDNIALVVVIGICVLGIIGVVVALIVTHFLSKKKEHKGEEASQSESQSK